jgi:pyrimidine-nucleoside phosphorylase
MHIVDVIASKRDGESLSREAIEFFVSGVSTGTIPDYQTSALLMAIVLRGMTPQEVAWLTDAILRSGERIDLSDVPGRKVGKHSTGGVGDKVSIVLAPLAAACGVVVPKMSGRGLGHTGGTLDKLESIPGFRVDLTIDAFKRVLTTVGTSIIGQSASLAPADKKLYALRDVTATVESIPLIASSVMGKKLAEGSEALVLDVKCGHGAFMKDLGQARALAAAMVGIGTTAGVTTEAFVTDMDAPLGSAVGNALEIVECIETLKGRGPADLTELAVRFAARMVVLAGIEQDEDAATRRVRTALTSGAALERLARLIEAQQGNPRVVDDNSLLPATPGRDLYRAPRSGFVTAMDAGSIGLASSALGAGRRALGEAIDPAVGVLTLVRPGDEIRAGDPLVDLHHRDGRGLESARDLLATAVHIGDAPVPSRNRVLDIVR